MQKRLLMVALLAIAVLGGCAQDVGDIDRTQPNKLHKSVFEGEWYVRQTVVGVPGTAMSSFVGLEGDANRIHFKFQEGLLVAHRSYEDVLGIDTSNAPVYIGGNLVTTQDKAEDGKFYGAPIAAFGIQSHFDIQRQYNPQTGEQSNVLGENMSDRYWADRDYVRVDWSRNLVSTAVDPMSSIAAQSSVNWWEQGSNVASPVYVECKNKDGEWYDCDPDNLDQQKEIAYLEITSTYTIEPNWIDCIFNFGFPMYGGDCGPEQIQVRTSFAKIEEGEPDRYEPRQYTDREMDWFGYFRTERCAYDRLYGCNDAGRVFLANRQRIWEDWKDENGNVIEMANRTPKPIVYYLNDEYPLDLLDETVLIALQYSEAFREVVRSVKGDPSFNEPMFYLCANSNKQLAQFNIAIAKQAGRTKDDVQGEYGEQVDDFDKVWDETPGWDPNWVMENQTVDTVISELAKGYNAGVCERPNTTKRLGDIRYSYIAWVDNPQQVGPLGYGPSTTDPLTGETFTGDAYMYGASVDTYTQYTVDLIDLINGDLDPVEYGYGETVKGYLRDIEQRYGIPEGPDSARSAELERLERFDHRLQQVRWRQGNPDFFQKLTDVDPSMLTREVDNYRSIWNRLKGTRLEEVLLTEEVKVGLGAGLFGPSDPVDAEMIDALDPTKTLLPPAGGMTSQLNVSGTRNYWKNVERFSGRNMYMASFLDDQLLGLAQDFKEKYKDIEDENERRLRIFYDLRGIIYRHVAEHEVGHTMGLRHNFESSYDSMSYHPKYWEIRFANDGELNYAHNKYDRGISVLDHQSRIREYQYSSTMDYGARPNSQTHGIGLYDHAALAYGYGNLVHVFERGSEPHKIEATFNRIVNEGESIYDIFEEDEPLGRSSETITDWDDVENARILVDGSEVHTDGLDHNMDFWHYSVLPVMFTPDFESSTAGDMKTMYNREFVTLDEYRGGERLRVPYRFCSDEYRGALPSCNVFDEGADYNEIIDTAIQGYDAYYFHNSYRRGRAAWGLWLWPHIQRLYSRYFLPMGNMYQQWYIRTSEWGPAFSTNPWGGMTQQVGVEEGLRTLLGVLAAPHPGTYRYHETSQRWMHIEDELGYRCADAYDETCEDFPTVVGPEDQYMDVEPGLMVKWRYSRFDYDSGYYYYLRYDILSSFWDRLGALWALTTPESNFIGVDSASNITGFMIPYYILYDYELSRFFGGIMTEDVTTFAPVIPAVDGMGGSGQGQFALQDPLATWQELNDYGDPTKFKLVNPYPSTYGHSSFTDRLYTMAYALSFFQVLYDKSFNHASQIFIVGSGQGWTVADTDQDGVTDIAEGNEDTDMNGIPAYLDPDETPAEADQQPMPEMIAYTDPFNNKTYVAVDYKDFDSYGRRHFVPAIQLLRRAQNLKDRYLETNDYGDKYEVLQVREEIELMMMTNEIFANINAPWWIPAMAP